MAEIRTMKLNLLADTHSFSKGLKGANKQVDGFAGKLGKATRKAAIGFGALATAAGTAAIAVGVDAVKAAIDDEASQKRLSKALKNTTKATDKQVAATEEWITKQQFTYGFSDSKLRPALQRLAASTKDITKAQQLTSVAMDVSAGTGKDLTTVAGALAKAYDGNFGALKKLGVPLDKNIIKSKDFNKVLGILSTTFTGQAASAADTFQGRVKILNEKIGEFKEGIGAKLIPWLGNALTAINQVSEGFGGKTGLTKRVGNASDALSAARDAKYEDSWYNVGDSLKNVADSFKKLFDTVNSGDGKSGQSAIQSIADALNSVAHGIDNIKNAYTSATKIGGNLIDLISLQGLMKWGHSHGLAKNKPYPARALGGPVTGGGSYLVGERGPEIFTPRSSGSISANGSMGGHTFIFNGVIDGESARRSIERLFQTSSRISGPPNFKGAIS